MHARTTILTVFVAIFTASPAFAQLPVEIPAHPIQDLSAVCEPVLDNPVSGTDALAWLDDPNLPFFDLDRDGYSNEEELRSRSDPTYARSTPYDHDGDGVRSADDTPANGGCDFDPRIPARVNALVTCVSSCAAPETLPVSRNGIVEIRVTTTNAAGEPAIPDDNTATCSITYETTDFPSSKEPGPQDFVIPPAVGENGVFVLSRPISNGDFGGLWHLTCKAELGNVDYQSPPVTFEVLPRTLDLALVVDQLGPAPKYFDGEPIFVKAFPSAGAHRPDLGSAAIAVTDADGMEVFSSDEPGWDATATFETLVGAWTFEVPRDTDLESLGLAAYGDWTITVEAEDAASGEPNTGEASRGVAVTDDPIDEVTLTLLGTDDLTGSGRTLLITDDRSLPPHVDNRVAKRGESLLFTAAYTHRGEPAAGTVFLTLTDPAGADHEIAMVPSEAVGTYQHAVTLAGDDLTGDWVGIADVRSGPTTLDESGNVVYSVLRTDFDVILSTNQATYGLPTPSAPIITDAPFVDTARVGQAVGQVVGLDPRGAATSIVAGTEADPDEILVTATVRREDVVGDALATFSLYYFQTADVPQDDHVRLYEIHNGLDRNAYGVPIVLDQDMERTCGAIVCDFRGTYELSSADPPGRWVVVVRIFDEADTPNRAEAAKVIEVGTASEVPVPPQVEITEINDRPATDGMILDEQAWNVEGTYRFTEDDVDPTNPAAVNMVWVRVNGGTAEWVLADLDAASHSWSAVLNVQSDYGLAADGTFAVEAFSAFDPALTASGDSVFDPNEPTGALATAIGTMPVGALTSTVSRVSVQLDFPTPPTATINGVLDAHDQLVPPGRVLWHGTTHKLQGTIDLNGNTLSNAVLRIERVVFDNCQPLYTGSLGINQTIPLVHALNDNDDEWCLRDRVTEYPDGTSGFDLVDPPVLADLPGVPAGPRVVEIDDGDDDTFRFQFTWDIRDSAPWQNDTVPHPCEANRDASPLVETNDNLVRRVNHRYDGKSAVASANPARFPFAGAYDAGVLQFPNCHNIPEQLEDQPTLQPWQKAVVNPAIDASLGLPGRNPLVEDARYWVWIETTTDKGFQFDQTKPKHAADIAEAAIDDPNERWDLMANAENPNPSAIDAAANGAIPGYDAVQLSFGAYPTFRINTIERQTPQGDEISAVPGEPFFRLLDTDEEITITGEVFANGNDVQWSDTYLVLYMVLFDNCVDDNQGDGSSSDGFDADDDGEWCLVDRNQVPIALGAGDQSAAGGWIPFTATWTPEASGRDSGTWWAAVSFKTGDGDRSERLPPIVDARASPAYSGNPTAALFDTITFNWLHKAEQLCRAATCPAHLPPIPFVVGEPGVLGNDYPGVSLNETTPAVQITRLTDLYGPAAPGADPGLPCEIAGPAFASTCRYPGPHLDPLTGRHQFLGNIRDDQIAVQGSSTALDGLGEVVQLDVAHKVIAYDTTSSGSFVNGLSAYTLLATLDLKTQQEVSDPSGIVTAFTRTVSQTVPDGLSGSYQEKVDWSITLDTTQFRETILSDPAFVELLASSFVPGQPRDHMFAQVVVTARTAGGEETKLVLPINVDRLQPGTTDLVQVGSDEAPEPTIELLDGRPTKVYTVSGNNVLRFESSYDDGGALGDAATYAQRLTAIDVSTSLLGPAMEWSVAGTWSNGGPLDRPVAGLGLVPTDPVVLDGNTPVVGSVLFPLAYCPNDPTDVRGETDACSYEGSEWNPTTDGARLDGVTMFFLPLRVGIDPPFALITASDPWDPSTWVLNTDPDTSDTTFGADLSASGAFVERQGQGHLFADAWNDTTVNFFFVAVEGDLDPYNLRAAVGSGLDGVTSSVDDFNEDPMIEGGPQAFANKDWVEAGLDQGWAEECRSASDPSACLRDLYLPIDAAVLAACLAGTGGDPDAIDACYTNPNWTNDEWARCVFIGYYTLSYDPDQCTVEGYEDETIREGEVVLSRSLPIWLQTSRGMTSTETGDNCPTLEVFDDGCADQWQPPEDPNAPARSDGNHTILRAYIWRHLAAPGASDGEITVVGHDDDAGTVTFDLSRFADTIVADVDAPDFGRMKIPDGEYLITVRVIDNTECFSSEDGARPGIANDACVLESIKIVVENDKDNDGVSDIREQWLNARIRDAGIAGSMRAELETLRPDGAWPYGDRHYMADTRFPDFEDPASTEEDWDGDGVPNAMRVEKLDPSLPGPPYIRLDLEFQLNMDPLTPDLLDAVPGQCDVFGLSPLDFVEGRGPVGDRNNNCIPNVLDSDKRIFRVVDSDGDGYSDDWENEAGSRPDDANSTPRDIDGDGIPNDLDDFVEALEQALPEGSCVASETQACPHGHSAVLPVGAGGLTHVYIDMDADGPTFSVGVAYEGAPPPGCNQAEPGHCELASDQTLGDLAEIVAAIEQTIEDLTGIGGGTVETVIAAIQAAACIDGAPDPLSGACEDSHTATVHIGQAGVEHAFVEVVPDPEDPLSTTVLIGLHYTGADAPPGCPPIAGRPGHCSFGTVGGPGGIDPFDIDGDGFTNQQELSGTDSRYWSNPFYARSTPGDEGFGFPADWDADRYKNERENGVSDPFQRCSTPADPQGWPTNDCE